MVTMAEINPHGYAFRKMLIELDKMIQSHELHAMKFQCKSARIGDRNLDKIETSLDLWVKLEERGYLGPNNLTFLKALLQDCTDNRRDVLDVVSQFEKSLSSPTNVVNGTSDGRGGSGRKDALSKEIRFLEENLGRDWKFFMRSLGLSESKLEMCIDSHPRNVKEQIHMAFTECLSSDGDSGSITKTDILHALQDIQRNDLYYKLSRDK